MKTLFQSALIVLFISCGQTQNPEDQYKKALNQIQNQQYSNAIGLLNDVIKQKPNFDSAYVERAYCFLQNNEPSNAMEDVEKCLKLNYENMSAYLVRGMIHYYNLDYKNALKDFDLLIRIQDSSTMNLALRERGYLNYERADYEKSLEDFSRILETDSLNAAIYTARGIAKLQHNVYEKYKDSIALALQESSFYSTFFSYFKITYFNNPDQTVLFDTRGALEDFNTAIRLDRNYSFAYFNRSKVYEHLDSTEVALKDLNKAIKLQENSDYYVSRALIYKSLNQTQASLNDFNKAIEINPNNAIAFANRGHLKKEQLQDATGAQQDYKSAQKLGIPINE